MTRNHNEHFPFPATQGISPSSLTLLSDKASKYACPLKYRFQKVDKIERPPTRAMQCGILFDIFCNNETGEVFEFVKAHSLSEDDRLMVSDKYLAYKSHINYETDWLQVPVWKELECFPCDPADPRYLFGYVDRIETRHSERCEISPEKTVIPTKIIDHKLSKEPWPMKERKDGTFSSTKVPTCQGQVYIACIEAMYGVRVPMEFHVVNLKTDEIQIITYRPQVKSLKALDKMALDAIELRESGDFIPEPDPFKCQYCDYQIQCASHMKGGDNEINKHIRV